MKIVFLGAIVFSAGAAAAAGAGAEAAGDWQSERRGMWY